MTATDEHRSWQLVVPFEAPEFDFSEAVNGSVSGHSISIRSRGFPYSTLLVEGFDTSGLAEKAFRDVRIGMLAACLDFDCGIRVRSTVEVIEDDTSVPSEKDQPFVCRQGRPPQLRVSIAVGRPQFILERALPRLLRKLEFGVASTTASEALSDPKVALAATLYVDSFFEESDEARFITLVGALEVLKKQPDKSREAQALVDRWKVDLQQLTNDNERTSLNGALEYLRKISISKAIEQVVANWLGPDQVRPVRQLYKARSDLVHDGIQPADMGATRESAQSIVRNLLTNMLLDPPFEAAVDR